MASSITRFNIEKLDGNIVQNHGGSKQVGLKQLGSKQVGFKQLGHKQVELKQLGHKQVGFKQLGSGVETGVHGVQIDKRVWFEVELHEAQADHEANVRNLDLENILCNGTRLICKRFDPNVINAEIVDGHHAGIRVFFLRIPHAPSEEDILPFKLNRKQFHKSLSFAMIN
nr:ATP-dependent DNA helicase PIF1-like [Tanacetum cinerariifolium]